MSFDAAEPITESGVALVERIKQESRRRVLIAALAAVVVQLAVVAHAEEGDAARLAEGDILVTTDPVKDSDVPLVTVRAVVDAPPENLWAIIQDCGNYAKAMPRIQASKELLREGNREHFFAECLVTATMPFPLPNLTSHTRVEHTIEPGKKWLRTFKLVEGDYLVNEGSWTLVPYGADGKRTFVTYRLHAQPKLPLPQGLVSRGQQRALSDIMKKLRELTATPTE